MGSFPFGASRGKYNLPPHLPRVAGRDAYFPPFPVLGVEIIKLFPIIINMLMALIVETNFFTEI
jgi:hypothetical protein